MYTLTTQTDTRRTYINSVTDTEIYTKLIYTDGSGNRWWAFEDLLQMPFIRKKASEKVAQLYGIGLTREDIAGFTSRMKAVLKGNDPDRYERAYAELLQFESITIETGDAFKQSISMCAIYILGDQERVDTFSFTEATKKIEQWAIDLDAQAFFLNWLSGGMNDFTKLYTSITQTASSLTKS